MNLLIICGPTATGKTALGIELAEKYNGEIISADSRQVYKGMDIGTGKDIEVSSKFEDQSSKWLLENKKLHLGFREKEGIPIWLVDIVSPDYRFNVGDYRKLAWAAIGDIQKRRKLPIIVGGTGLYIKSLLEPLTDISIPPNDILRNELEKLSVEALQQRLKKIDELRFNKMNSSDQQNPRRLIRAIEIALYYSSSEAKAESRINNVQSSSRQSSNNNLLICLTARKEFLFKQIDTRVDERVTSGIIDEVSQLIEKGYSWDQPSMSATGYAIWKEYFEKKKSLKETVKTWKLSEQQYAKRQLTWFKKMKNIQWFDMEKSEYKDEIFGVIKKWYTDVSS